MKKTFVFLFLILFCSTSYAGIVEIEDALMNKDYPEVRNLSEEILGKSTNQKDKITAQYYLGLSQLRLKQYAQARNAFQIVKNAQSSLEMYDKASLGMLESYYMAGFYNDALQEGESLLRKSPHSQLLSAIYLKLARTHLKMMKWKKAKEYLTKIIEQFPSSLEFPIARQLMEEKEYFSVQVGAFQDQRRAIQLANELKTKGEYAYIVETASSSGEKFFRVRVGHLTALDDAQSLENKLADMGYPTLIYP